MATLYYVRFWFQGTSAALSVMTALSYCSPLIETFGKRFGERLVGQALGWTAKRVPLARAALVFAKPRGLDLSTGVSAIIWYFDDGELQKWCDRCAFGNKRKAMADAYTNADLQLQRFAEALKEAA
ncbi:hypothetical protein [Ideonella sp. YS5]|uniref:hypothetical protein n=1 Tax=Ideonella sp. YS5 TaxID=3453714 RepID=UPI003EEBD1C3